MTTFLAVFLLAIAGLNLAGTIGTPFAIGKPRKPITPADATARLIIGLIYTVVFVWVAILLLSH